MRCQTSKQTKTPGISLVDLVPYSDAAGEHPMRREDFLRGSNKPIKRWRCGTRATRYQESNIDKKYLPPACRETISHL